ncbi:MAG TPA: flagellar basal body L-ring protein FlgH [Candidatus Baltobacteraceae bacterium]|nr:flagellar basal body L-ring protein FlgH [Candidatus Baltobacteraceae bacterium]
MRWMGAIVGLVLIASAGICSAESLWRDGKMGFLIVDNRAARVGDIVTVLVTENSSSDLKVDTNTKKDAAVAFNLSNFFGNTTPGGSKNKYQLDYTGNSEQKGSGNITRTGAVTAQIPAKVIRVLPSGLLVVEGRRAVVVNEETQTLAFSGMVRPEDISPDNTVASTLVADAEITVIGKGILANKQRPGFIQMLIDLFRIF